MKEIDFLPEWYKESKRRRSRMHRQYVVLTVVFLSMLTYNLFSEHRISRASAKVSLADSQRVEAEAVMAQFNQISQTLSRQKTKADVIQQVDSRLDADAVLAEISHVISDRIILKQLEFISEPVAQTSKKTSKSSGSAVRAAGKSSKAGQDAPLGDVRFRVVLVGVAVDPEDVSTLLVRLDGSPYFKEVKPSFSKPGTLTVRSRTAKDLGVRAGGSAADQAGGAYQVTDFEITCYLANFKEVAN